MEEEKRKRSPDMHTEKGSALSPGRRRRMVTLQVPATKNRSPGRNTFPIRVQKERFLLFLTSDKVRTIYSKMKKNAAKNSRLETESHLMCAPSTQSDDRRQVHPPL